MQTPTAPHTDPLGEFRERTFPDPLAARGKQARAEIRAGRDPFEALAAVVWPESRREEAA